MLFTIVVKILMFGNHIFTEDSSGGFAAFAFVVRYVLQTMAAIEWIVFKSTLILSWDQIFLHMCLIINIMMDQNCQQIL